MSGCSSEVEQMASNQKVVGSIPITRSIIAGLILLSISGCSYLPGGENYHEWVHGSYGWRGNYYPTPSYSVFSLPSSAFPRTY